MKTDLPNFLLFFLVLLLLLSAEEVSIDNAPRIITENGNLIFQTSLTNFIRFETRGGKKILLNEIDLHDFSAKIDSIKNSMEQIKDLKKCNCESINLKLEDFKNNIKTLQDDMAASMTQMTALTTSLTDFKKIVIFDNCKDNPCHNNGKCVDRYDTYKCLCPENYKGPNCMDDVDECTELMSTDAGCHNNARCENYPGSFRCICTGKWSGVLCNLPLNGCAGSSNAELCGHGTCIVDHSPNNLKAYKCFCDIGWELDPVTKTCIIDVDECNVGRFPCSIHPEVPCINIPGHFTCGPCPNGFEGNGYQCRDINECARAGICVSNEECINTFGSYKCQCIEGMRRRRNGICQLENVCEADNGGCNINAQCRMNTFTFEGRVCTCNPGYVGNGVGINGCSVEIIRNTTNRAYRRCVRRRSCQNGGRCQLTTNGFRCQCAPGYSGSRCRTIRRNPCTRNPCLNNGRCEYLQPNHYRCHCTPFFNGINCETEHTECGGTFISPREEFQIALMISQSTTSSVRSFRFPCLWTIIVTDEQFIQVTPLLIQLSGPCSEEYVELKERSSMNDRPSELGKYCQESNSVPRSLNTSGPILLIKAKLRRGTLQNHGFNLTIRPKNIAIENLDCCRCLDFQSVMTNATRGLFQSIHFPLKYPIGVSCTMQYQRQFGERYRVVLQIKTVDLGNKISNCSDTDFLKISFVEKGEVLITACNQETFYNRRIITSGFKIQHFSDFRADSSPSRFQLIWTKSENTDPCGGIVSVNPKGTINGPALLAEDEAFCSWKLEHTNTSKLINFKGIFGNWAYGDCSVYLKILNVNNDGQPKIVWQTCQRPKMLDNVKRQLDGDVIIEFGKSKGVSTPAFIITVEYTCGISVDMDQISTYEFQSDNYPDNYDDNANCFYGFLAQTKKISVTFTDFDVNDEYPCNSDYLEIVGRSSVFTEKKFCNGNREQLIPIGKHQLADSLSFQFRSNSTVSGRGFRASVTSFECGGSFYLKHRLYLAYPETYLNLATYNLNNEYGINKNCTWDIYSRPGTYMFVIFDHFHLEYHSNCRYDYLTATYGNETKTFCGNIAETFHTRSNRLKFRFVSDSSMAGEGFQMRIYVSSTDRHCHDIIEASEGIILSPEIGSLSRPYLCYKSIKVPEGRKVGLNITIFGAEPSNTRPRYMAQCFGKTKLKIINGVLGSTEITSLCLDNPQIGEIKTSYNLVTIVYLVPSYSSAPELNFTIQFYSIDEECGSTHNDDYGEVASPNYPLFAPRNTFCRWQIRANPGEKIGIMITHIRSGSVDETAQCNDRFPVIKLQSLTKEINILCTNDTIPTYTFDDQIVSIIFNNNHNSKYRFRLRYRKTCTYSTDAIHGRIESNNLHLYYPFGCLWTLTSLRGGSIALQIDQFDLPPPINGICLSYVEITDRRGNIMRKTCGNELTNRTFTSSSLPIKIRQRIDRNTPVNVLRAHTGLILEYQAQGCIYNLGYDPHEEFSMDGRMKYTGEIKSPQYPKSVSNTDCAWYFETIPGYSIKLTFDVVELDSFLNCTEGPILRFWESQNTNEDPILDICQRTVDKPIVFQSSTHQLFMKFLSANDANGGQRKFHGRYQFVNTSCEYDLRLAEGVIKSPNYPNLYPNNARCSWKLTVRESMSVHLQFLDFELEDGSCRHDSVDIYSQVNDNLKLHHKKICGQYRNLTALSSESIGNQMLITFRTDSSVVKKGFKAKFFEGCGGMLMATGRNEFIFSPNYPHTYSLPDGICKWTLAANTSEPGLRIFFYFTGFEGSTNNPTTNCSLTPETPPDNSLTILDGLADSTSVKAVFCSTQPYHPIISTGHHLTVILRSRTGHAIFKASYGTGSSACGGDFYLDDGLITSPFYPNAVNLEIDCVYIIRNSPGSEINLIFEDFTRQNTHVYLPHDFLDIRNGPNETSPFVGRFYTIMDLQNVTGALRFNNSVWLRLRSQGGDYTNNIKFLAKYHINYINMFRSDQGVLASPQFGHVYSQDTLMSWTLDSVTTESLEITFEKFSVGRKLADGDCSRGRLRITDANGLSSSYCGSTIPPVRTFSTPITIQLSAEGYRYPGFLLRWAIPRNETHTKIDSCSFIIKASKSPQILTSPNYPNFDPINRDCQWIIQTDSSSFLQIRMLNFSLEPTNNCKYENLTISFFGVRSPLNYYREYIQKMMCAPNLTAFNFFNEYYFQSVQLNFKVDPFDIYPGFRLSYQKSCGVNIIDSIEGWLQNEEYPNVLSEYKNCTYRLIFKTRRAYQFNFTALNLPPKTDGKCTNGYLEISTRRSTEKYCGTSVPQSLTPLLIGSSLVVVRLFGDFQKYSPYTGFQLKYSLEEVEECGGTHYLSRYSDYVTLSSPRNGTSIAPHHIECQWYLSSPYGTRMQIDFVSISFYDWDDPSGPCVNSFLTFYDGSTRLAPRIGGNKICIKKNSIFTTGNKLVIIFRNMIAMARFKLAIKISSCGGLLYRSNGIISSPNYPLNYPRNINCSWSIQVRLMNSLAINFLDRELDFDCSKSNLTLISVSEDEENIQWSNCNRTDYFFNVHNNKLKILFTTNSTTPRRGFQMKYESVYFKCGGEYSDPSRQLESTNYPSSLPPYAFCRWQITADISKRIVITLLNLNLRNGCITISGNYFIGYRKRICNSNLENYVIDTKLSFVTVTMYSERGNRVSFRYDTELPALCSDNIRPSINGTGIISIESPSIGLCNYAIHNYPEGVGTILFNLITYRNLDCHSSRLTLQSIVISGSPGNMVDRIVMCNSSDIIKRFVTMGRKVDLVYESSRLNLTNVKIEVEYKYNRCGGLLTEPYGTIMSPGYPEKYPDNTNCEWVLKAPDNMHINIVIRKLHLELHQTCSYDHLYIRYGAFHDSPAFMKFCGKRDIENETIIFRNNLLRFSFHSDHTVRNDGFLIDYTFFDAVDNCNGVLSESVGGSIMSPNYPQPHPSNLRCNWTIIVPQGYRIKLTFKLPFDIEGAIDNVCRYDSLKIYDSNPNNILANLCGNVPPFQPILSSTNRIGLVFYTDFNHNLDGFKAEYKTVCGGVFNETYGVIQSPTRFISSRSPLSCSFIVPQWKNSLTVLVLHANLKKCIYSSGKIQVYLKDRFNNYYFSREICGKTKDPIVIMHPGEVMLQYNISYWDGRRYSFSVKYLHDVFVKEFKNVTQALYIKTPQFPSPYHHNADLLWKFDAPPGYVFYVRLFSVDIELGTQGCNFDYVAFYNNNSTNSSNRVNIFCGTHSNIEPFKIESNVLTIHFYSDFSHWANHSGFSAMVKPTPGVSFGCGGIINVTQGTTGYLSSLDLNNDGRYDNDLHCNWQLIAPFGNAIKITFENSSVNMEKRYRNMCFFDFLKIYNGPYSVSPIIRVLCGNDQIDPIISGGNMMLISFISDETINGRGFKLTYTSLLSQNHIITTATNLSQTLQSPNYPNDSSFETNVYAEIETANDFDHVIVEVTDLQIRSSVNCSVDQFILQDITLKYRNKVRKICKPLLVPHVFISSHDKLLVQYKIGPAESAMDSLNKRFSLTYKIYSCNRTERAYSGSIINIETYKTKRYGKNQYCNLTLTAPEENLRYQFYFKTFRIERSMTCRYDYIRFIFGKPNEQQITLPKICGTSLPASFVSNSSQVTMVFFSDQSVEFEGFHITYVVSKNPTVKCGGDIELDSGVVTSPGFGHNYYEEGQCIWNIALLSEKVLQWKITDLGLNNNTFRVQDCGTSPDFVSITSGNLAWRFCGNEFNDQPVQVESNRIAVTYSSLTGGTGIGFRLEWDIAQIY